MTTDPMADSAALGPLEPARAALDLAERSADPPAPSGHVVLFGLGTVGSEILQRLRESAVDVVAVDRAPGARACLLAETLDAPVIRGDVTTPDVLAQLGLDRARSFIACTSDDKTNLQVALLVHDLRPDIRTVVRLDNDNLGRQLEARFPSWTVLGLPGQSSPAFVAAALAPDTHRCWRVDDALLAFVERPIDEPALLRELPDAVALYVRHESGEVEHWPAPPTPLARGDRLGLVVEVAHLAAAGRGAFEGVDAPLRSDRLDGLTRRLAGLAADLDRRLLTALALALGMGWLSVFVFMEFKGLELVPAIYYVVTTMVTVGYGDINLLDDPPMLKLYGVGLMLVSLMVVSVLTAFVTNWVLSARLTRLFGSQRSTAADHVIVCGLGTVGYRVFQELRTIAPSTAAIDSGGRDSLAAEARQVGATVITGDARQGDAFRRANVEEARSIVVATSDDLVNLEIALSAREANPRVRTVVRLFDEEFAQRVRSTFDVDHVLSPAALAAPAFAAAALGRSIVDRFAIDGAEYLFVRMHVDRGSAWVGATIADLLRGREATVLSYQPAIGPSRRRPSGRLPLHPGDVVTLICSRAAWAELESETISALSVGPL